MKFMNVKEHWFLYDTILISPWVDNLPHPIPGWYNSFAAIGQADDLTFFTSRNKSIGLSYNNQESRDQIPFALTAESLSVTFFAPSIANQIRLVDDVEPNLNAIARTDSVSPFWESEVPQHTSLVFRTNQDDRLKTVCSIAQPGYGPIGNMRGQGDNSALGGESGSLQVGGQGRAHLKYRWLFDGGIGIPRRATISVELRMVEWLRQRLQNMWGPGYIQFWPYDPSVGHHHPLDDVVYKWSTFGIQVALTGRREVQQRGEHHA